METQKIRAEKVSNGMITVPKIAIQYKGYTIQPKLDMGKTPWLVDGNYIRKGYIVTQDGTQIMPGGAWFYTVGEAKQAIDVFESVGKNATMFHLAWEALNGMDVYEEV